MKDKLQDPALPPSDLPEGHPVTPKVALGSKKPRAVARPSGTEPRAPKRRGLAAALWTLTILLGAAGLTVGSAWVSLQLILNPDTAIWINRFLPEWTRIPITGGESVQTLSEIRANISQAGLVPGELLPLTEAGAAKSKTPPDVLLPILDRQQQIVELRVYRPTQVPYGSKRDQYFWLATQVAIAGPEESFVIAPLVDAQSANQGSSRALPLTKLNRFSEKPLPTGIWFNLSGQWAQGNLTASYGKIVHYNPARNHLSLMLQWTSPTDQGPSWQEITGGEAPELIINQTVGLEPTFQVYQVKPRKFLPDPIQLEPIALTEFALKSRAYENALVLARSGLWTPALQWLQSLKQKNPSISQAWSPTAQAQLDLIQLHAQFTQAQATKSWASPSERVLTNLIDGRWAQALQVLQSSTEGYDEIAALLKADTGRLWNRVEAALQVSPNQPDVKAWGALIVAAQAGKSKAIAWLGRQSKNTPKTNERIYKLLNQFGAPPSDLAAPNSEHISQIVGSAEPVSRINAAAWVQPDSKAKLQLEAGQVWYQVQVAAFYDGKRWRRPPFSDLKLSPKNTAQKLWNLLGLQLDSQLQGIVWIDDTQQSFSATVKAMQVQGGSLQLLAMGEPLPQPPPGAPPLPRQALALTNTALQWLEPTNVTLLEISQQQPELAAALLQNLWRELQNSGQLLPGPVPSLEQMMQQEAIGGWLLQQIDLTGNNQPELILTFNADALAALNPNSSRSKNSAKSRTLIFSESGTLIYSELNQEAGQSLTAIADLGDGGPATLVIESPKNYSLQRWSSAKKRFE